MRPLPILLLVLPLVALATPLPSARAPRASGHLVIVGGGGTTDDILVETVALTAKDSPSILILPQASEREDRGKSTLEMFLKLGLQDVTLLDPLGEEEDAHKAVQAADVIWFPGGDQEKLMLALGKKRLTGVIARHFSEGAVIGGTSAGAAVMSAVMISGKPDPGPYVAGSMRRLRGLGLWPEAIVDQHFVERGRNNRLLTAVLDRPRLLGVGVSERTAAIISGEDVRVVGEGQVHVYDARQSGVQRFKPGDRQRAMDIRLHVLQHGDSWAWRQ